MGIMTNWHTVHCKVAQFIIVWAEIFSFWNWAPTFSLPSTWLLLGAGHHLRTTTKAEPRRSITLKQLCVHFLSPAFRPRFSLLLPMLRLLKLKLMWKQFSAGKQEACIFDDQRAFTAWPYTLPSNCPWLRPKIFGFSPDSRKRCLKFVVQFLQ